MTAACAVLIDMESGREDGWSWLGELREQDSVVGRVEGVVRAAGDSRKRHVPVIVLSDVDQRGRAESLGADAFFVKPLSGNELLTSLDAMLSAP
jgi:DNA-binding response OmpR family regulator